MKEFTEEILERLINKQFEINWINNTYKNLKEKQEIEWESWFSYYTTTKEKELEFIKYLRKELKPFIHKVRLEKEVNRFILNRWLRVAKNK